LQGGDDARDRDIHDRGVEQDHEEPEAEEDQYQPRVRARLDGLRWACHENLTEREAVGLDARIEEFDLEGSILDAAPLADQLVEPLIISSALALAVDVGSVGCACGLAIDKDAKPHRSGTFGRSHDEVDVTGVKAKGDTPARLVLNCCPPRDRPKSRYGPIIQVQTAGN